MPQEPEKISDHVSVVKVEEPVALPHCADVYFEADFGDGRTVHIRTRVPLKALARIDHRFGNEGDFGRPERFSESFAIDPVQVE